MKTARKRHNPNKRRMLEQVATVLLVIFLLTLIATWLTFQHKPNWYRPAQLDEIGIERAKKQSVALIDLLSDKIVEGKPFEVILKEDQINEWLAALPHAWPGFQEQIPQGVLESAVRFEPDSIRIGVRWEDRGWQAIVGVKLAVSMTNDQRGISVKLLGVSGGSIPAPRSLLERLLDPVLEKRAGYKPASRRLARFDQLQSTSQLFDGVEITNRGVWFNGERPFQITSLTVREGTVRLTIEPL